MFTKPIFKKSDEYYKFIEYPSDFRCTWDALSYNPYAIHILEQYCRDIAWENASTNPAVGHLLKANLHEIWWNRLATNTSSEALKLFKLNMDELLQHYDTQRRLSENENDEALNLLERNPGIIVWETLVYNTNPRAIKLIEQNLYKLDKNMWSILSSNPSAIYLLKENKHNIDWTQLAGNPSHGAMLLLKEYLDSVKFRNWRSNISAKIKSKTHKNIVRQQQHNINVCKEFWKNLSENSAVTHQLLIDNYKHISWKHLSSNSSPFAIQILRKNTEKINWNSLSRNESPEAMKIIEENLDKANWLQLAGNLTATHVIEKKLNTFTELEWFRFCANNPAAIRILFQLDIAAMRSAMQPFAEELAQCVFHPERLARQAERCEVQVWELLEMYE